MLAITSTLALSGIVGFEVKVEVDSDRGLPAFHIVGMGDISVKEAGERVHSSIINSGFEYPRGRVTVNLCPASVRKKGSHFDLAIAVGVLKATKQVASEEDIKSIFIGELSLEGRVIPVRGVLPMVRGIDSRERTRIYVAVENAREAYLAVTDENTEIYGVATLRELIDILRGKSEGERYFEEISKEMVTELEKTDFSDVRGHYLAKEAIVTAIAGGHGLIMIGPPGTGKSMLAKRIPTVLPPMSHEERIETSMIYSLLGALNENYPIVRERPFQEMGPRATEVTILGGGNEPLPGIVSLANNGVLFIDEFLEFSGKQIECLRRPIEEKKVNIIRKGVNYSFPASFTLVAATNPCKCGKMGCPGKVCTCSPYEIERYRSKLSGPIADRIDMSVELPKLEYSKLTGRISQSSGEMRERVNMAREIQSKRFKDLKVSTNSEMNERMITEFCRLGKNEKTIMERAYDLYGLSPRRYHKILKLARTISDLSGENDISENALLNAIGYTKFLNMYDRDGADEQIALT